MVCENCKERQATITITQVKNGQKNERHTCEVCASKFHPFYFEMKEEPISLQQFITNWFGSPPYANKASQNKKMNDVHCPTCQLTYRNFLKQGKVGCATCYEAFREYLPAILEKLQAGTSHITEEATSNLVQDDMNLQIQQLREQQKLAIEQERFEEAAQIRDTLKALQGKSSFGGDTP